MLLYLVVKEAVSLQANCFQNPKWRLTVHIHKEFQNLTQKYVLQQSAPYDAGGMYLSICILLT